MRLRIWFVIVLALSALLVTLPAQVGEEAEATPAVKKRQSTPAKPAPSDETPTPTPKAKSTKAKAKPSPSTIPEKSPTPTPKPKAKKKSSAEDEPTPTRKATATAEPKRASPAVEDSESATPKPKAKKKKPSDEGEASPVPKAKAASGAKGESLVADDSESATPTPTPKSKSTKKKSTTKKGSAAKKKKGSARKTITKKGEDSEKPAKAVKAGSPSPSEAPAVESTPAVGRAVAVPSPVQAAAIEPPSVPDEPAELTIEKMGYEKRPGFWSRIFGGGGSRSSSGAGYRYLTRSVRAEIDRAPANRRNPPWQYIVVHNSGTRQGNAKVFDYYHKRVKRMRNGLAYHFVIGNGTSTGNGQIEIGDRWRRQINGGHVHSDRLNNIGLGICFVGDFNRSLPTRAQLESCEELIRYLRPHCGKVGNRYAIVKSHREMNPPRWATDCPGDDFPYSWFRRFQ